MAQQQLLFKVCPGCGFQWPTRHDFLEDSVVKLVGYQVDFSRLESGLFLFNHDCQTTMAVAVREFADMYSGPVFEERKTGTAECPGFCLERHTLNNCSNRCECAYVREIIQKIKQAQ